MRQATSIIIVACRRKGFLRFLSDTKPDIMCCQEIKTRCPLNTPGYEQFWNHSQERGKSGTLILAKQPPLSWSAGFGIDRFDCEGRLITLNTKTIISSMYMSPAYTPTAPRTVRASGWIGTRPCANILLSYRNRWFCVRTLTPPLHISTAIPTIARMSQMTRSSARRFGMD